MATVAEQLVFSLKELGVRYVFGVPSGNMIDYMEEFRKTEGIDFITVGHEATAAIMADVSGRITGIPGVCFGTYGPGATNLSSGVGGALLDRSPMIAFTDEMPDHLRNRIVQMNINHQELFKPITKWTCRLKTDSVNETIVKSARIACTGVPGPVHIGLPMGMGKMQTSRNENIFVEKEENTDVYFDQLEKFERLFRLAKKPIIAAGLSAVKSHSGKLIQQIAERFQVPVVLTPMAKGLIFDDHPMYSGVLFHALSNLVAETYKQADLVVGIGYDPVEFNYEDWIPNVPLVHIDISPVDIDLQKHSVPVEMIGEINSTLEHVLNFQMDKKEWVTKQLLAQKEKIFSLFHPKKEKWGPRSVVKGLRETLPEEGILTVDVGAHLHLIGQMWRTPSPEKLIMTNGWSSMGFAIPAAMAAKINWPELPVACILGDGGFQMTVGELATVKRLGLAIVFVVIVDEHLSLIEIKQQKNGYDSFYGTALNPSDVYTAASYFGVPVIKSNSVDSYMESLNKAFAMNQPVVIEAHISGEEYKDLVLKPNK